MSPLSAIQPSVVPELRSLRPPVGPSGPGVISPAELESLAPAGLTPTEKAAPSFGSLLGRLVGEVNAKQAVAGDAVAGVLGGQNVSLHQAMIAMEEASVSFQLMVEVRNKLLEAYQEVMRMQV